MKLICPDCGMKFEGRTFCPKCGIPGQTEEEFKKYQKALEYAGKDAIEETVKTREEAEQKETAPVPDASVHKVTVTDMTDMDEEDMRKTESAVPQHDCSSGRSCESCDSNCAYSDDDPCPEGDEDFFAEYEMEEGNMKASVKNVARIALGVVCVLGAAAIAIKLINRK